MEDAFISKKFQNIFERSQVHGNSDRMKTPTLGPHRVFPGRLSVTRSFGDIEAKLDYLGGKEGVVIAKPDILSFKIKDNYDFVLLASKNNFIIKVMGYLIR